MLFRPSEIELVATQQPRYLEQVLCVGVRVAGALLQGDGFESGLEHSDCVLQTGTDGNRWSNLYNACTLNEY